MSIGKGNGKLEAVDVEGGDGGINDYATNSFTVDSLSYLALKILRYDIACCCSVPATGLLCDLQGLGRATQKRPPRSPSLVQQPLNPYRPDGPGFEDNICRVVRHPEAYKLLRLKAWAINQTSTKCEPGDLL
ncbi:hypothetical protein VMCG_05067 [Cytospora schulzeri]|uniref:Uncharacterized protein n=1 Tax=Cytospora schulzeri TaxID=448051 RepID=A0A423WM53_9PEZI|nr:hypothetical protein VMCG_05067 [Valsa malicola]